MCKYELSTSELSKVIVWHTYMYTQTDRQPDTTKIIYHAALRVVNNFRIKISLRSEKDFHSLKEQSTLQPVVIVNFIRHKRQIIGPVQIFE